MKKKERKKKKQNLRDHLEMHRRGRAFLKRPQNNTAIPYIAFCVSKIILQLIDFVEGQARSLNMELTDLLGKVLWINPAAES